MLKRNHITLLFYKQTKVDFTKMSLTDQEEETQETDFKQLVYEKLDQSGILKSMKAQLRAKLYTMLENGEVAENQSKALDSALKSENGRVALALVLDLLEKLNLKYTAQVFRSESGYEQDGAMDLTANLSLNNEEGIEFPLLVQLVDKIHSKNPTTDAAVGEDVSTEIEEAASIST